MYDTFNPPLDTAGRIIENPQQPDVVLLNARFSLNHQPTGIELSVYGRNLTNQLYQARQATQNQLGIGFFTLGEPRVIGVELKVPFGAK